MDQCKFFHASNKLIFLKTTDVEETFVVIKTICLASWCIALKIVWQSVCCFSTVTHHLVKEGMQ